MATPIQIEVLRHLNDNPRITGYRIERDLKLASSTAYKVLGKLKSNGYTDSSNNITIKGEEELESHKIKTIEMIPVNEKIEINRNQYNKIILVDTIQGSQAIITFDSNGATIIPRDQSQRIHLVYGTV